MRIPLAGAPLRLGLALVLTALGPACDPPTYPGPVATGPGEYVVLLPIVGLRQRITISPARPAPGDTLAVRSWLVNEGDDHVTTTATICGVHLRGSLAYDDPFGRCGGYSVTAGIEPGGSLADGRNVIVASSPGRYDLEIRHLLEPSFWLRIEVVVAEP